MMNKLGHGYIIAGVLKDKKKAGFMKVMCLVFSSGKKAKWSSSSATVIHFNEVPETDENYKPWRELTKFEKQNITFYPCQQLKPIDIRGKAVHLSTSVKNPNFWAYSKSPNELAYRVAKNVMMTHKHLLGQLYECRVYRVGRKNCPVVLDFGKERIYEKRMYELYDNEDMSNIHFLMKTYGVSWIKNNFL